MQGDELHRMIRVDQAGEFGATRIYEGQLAVMGDRGPHSAEIRHMAEQEREHRAKFDALLVRRGVRQQAALLGGPSEGQLRWRAQLQHLDSICQLVGQGVGVAVMPAAAAQRLAPASGARAVPLSDAWARRQLLLCTAREDQLPAHARQLLVHLQGLGSPEP